MTDPRASFAITSAAAQSVAGVIAARARGDLEGADTLLAGLDDHTRAAGGVFLADLAIALLAGVEGRGVGEVAAELSMQIAALAPAVPE